MSELETSADTERLSDLRVKLKARDGKPGYTRNVEEIKEEIARLESDDGAQALS